MLNIAVSLWLDGKVDDICGVMLVLVARRNIQRYQVEGIKAAGCFCKVVDVGRYQTSVEAVH